jgi:long-chain acyl-CoA synthetase
MAKSKQTNPPKCSQQDLYPWLSHYPKGVNWHADLPPAPLFQILDQAVERYGDRPFLDFMGMRFSYREAGATVERLAGAFQDLGIGKGVKAGLLLPNSPYFVFSFFAVLKTGATAVLYNPLRAESEIAQQIEDSETDFMITLDSVQIYSRLAGIISTSRLKKIIVCELGRILPFHKRILFYLLQGRQCAAIPNIEPFVRFAQLVRSSHRLDCPEIDPERDIAVLLYTGGTTGTPKGVCLSHHNLYANTLQSALGLPSLVPGAERVLAVIPFFHAFGLTAVMNTSIALGAEIILLPRFDIKELLKVISSKRPALLMAVPTIFSAIASSADARGHDFSSLKVCICGGDNLTWEVGELFQRLAGCDVVQGYGLTECSPVVTSGTPLGSEKSGSIGVPVPGTVVEIVSLDDDETVLGPGANGEICVSGPQVMLGYWKKAEETAQIIHDGRLHTGDVGSMDEDGYFYLVGRLKDMIISGGYKIYPRIVEAAIEEHPNVQDVAVVGLPNPHWGEEVAAFLVLKDGRSLSRDELLEFLKDKLSFYELPKSLYLLDELPRSTNAKILKTALRQNPGAWPQL